MFGLRLVRIIWEAWLPAWGACDCRVTCECRVTVQPFPRCSHHSQQTDTAG